jgi:hypothetical protein
VTPDRFRTLTEAYGADPRRWPAAERDAALALLAQGAPEVLRAHDEAGRLDGLLARHVVAAPGAALTGRIEASAPKAHMNVRAGRHGRPRQSRWFWLSGAGLASAGVMGAVAGALFVAHFSPVLIQSVLSDYSYSTTVFGDDLDGQDD